MSRIVLASLSFFALVAACGSSTASRPASAPAIKPPRPLTAKPPIPSSACRAWSSTDGEQVPAGAAWVSWQVLNEDAPSVDGNVSRLAVIVRTHDTSCTFSAGNVPERCKQLPAEASRIDARDCSHPDFSDRVVVAVERPEPSKLAVSYVVFAQGSATPARQQVLGTLDIAADTRIELR
jgi:hypothetical protein